AGPAPGRDFERAELVAAFGAVPVHADLCLFHRTECTSEAAGGTLRVGRAVVAAGACCCGTLYAGFERFRVKARLRQVETQSRFSLLFTHDLRANGLLRLSRWKTGAHFSG